MLNNDLHGFLYRIVAVVAGLAIIGFGSAPLHRSDRFGTNWFGELFVPLAVVLGVIVIAFAVFKAEWLIAKRVERKRRNQSVRTSMSAPVNDNYH